MNDQRLVFEKNTGEAIEKCATGIRGLDEITHGGLPQGRPTLVCGAAGCGKTVLGMEFLVRGATKDGEPGLFMSFEEGIPELEKNFRSMGFDLTALCNQKKLKIAPVELPRDETIESGAFSLEPLLIRLKAGIEESRHYAVPHLIDPRLGPAGRHGDEYIVSGRHVDRTGTGTRRRYASPCLAHHQVPGDETFS